MKRRRIVPYRGWAAAGKVVVLGRVIEEPDGIRRRLAERSRLARVAFERFATGGAGDATVSVSWQDREEAAACDPGGFVDAAIPVDGPPAIRTEARLAADGVTPAVAEVYGLQRDAQLGVISDIDDTVLETELSHPWRRAMQLIYSEQRMRLPFDGVATLFRAFAEPGNPIFYVSNAPWNLYEHVVELLDHNGLAKGPLLLRDRGLEQRAGEPHKRTALARLVADHPGLRFVLLGDSSRRDPERYVELTEASPGSVAAIYIRHVTGLLARRRGLDALTERARRAGVELVLAGDTVTMARHAESRGFVTRAAIGDVREAKREDEQAR